MKKMTKAEILILICTDWSKVGESDWGDVVLFLTENEAILKQMRKQWPMDWSGSNTAASRKRVINRATSLTPEKLFDIIHAAILDYRKSNRCRMMRAYVEKWDTENYPWMKKAAQDFGVFLCYLIPVIIATLVVHLLWVFSQKH